MRDYFYNTFPNHLRLLAFCRPSQIVRERIMRDESVVFFGGSDWESVSDDLLRIPEGDRPYFILSLFMVVLTDQCLYTYQRNSYQVWRQKTNFPKFGWSGFGPHNENPLKILWAPEREHAVIIDEILNLIPNFVRFMLEETRNFFDDKIPEIDTLGYFECIKQDSAYAFNEGQILRCFKAEFEALTNPPLDAPDVGSAS